METKISSKTNKHTFNRRPTLSPKLLPVYPGRSSDFPPSMAPSRFMTLKQWPIAKKYAGKTGDLQRRTRRRFSRRSLLSPMHLDMLRYNFCLNTIRSPSFLFCIFFLSIPCLVHRMKGEPEKYNAQHGQHPIGCRIRHLAKGAGSNGIRGMGQGQ